MGAEKGGAEAQVGGPEVLMAVSGGFGPVPGCPGARATRSDHFPSLTFREKKNIQSGLSFRISLGALFYSSPNLFTSMRASDSSLCFSTGE